MARWEQAKKLKRDPFARVVGQIEDGFLEEEPFFPRYSRIPDTFAEWEVISYEDEPPLFEVNPYIDRIENDPILILCAGMTHEDEEYRPPQSQAPDGLGGVHPSPEPLPEGAQGPITRRPDRGGTGGSGRP